MPLRDDQVYQRLGEDGIARLVEAFYAQVPGDEILGPMYAAALAHSGEGLDAAQGRLREFLVQRLGGPSRYSDARGHPRLRMRHMPFAIDDRAAQRWIALMDQAMHTAQIEPEVAQSLRPYFQQTAMFMVNRQEPSGTL